jgi:cell division protein FtsL
MADSGYASIAAPATTFPHDVCRTNAQCLHGGVCHVVHDEETSPHRSSSLSQVATTSKYNYCTCHAGYGGQRCESYCPLRCQNGGVCHAKASSSSGSSFSGASTSSKEAADPTHSTTYSCQCMGRWAGTICDVPYENCFDGSQCFNGGHCRVRNETITVSFCDCPTSWGGVACQQKVTSPLPSKAQQSSVWSDDLVTYGSLAIVLLATGVVSALFLVLRRRSRTASYKTVQISDTAENEETMKAEPSKEERWRNVV